MSEPTAFETRLRDELVGAITARQQRTPRRLPALRLGIAAAAASLVAGAVLVVTNLSGPAPALAVSKQDGRVVVDLRDPEATATAMERELAKAGVDSQVRRVPVSPSVSGRWLGALLLNGAPAVDKNHSANQHPQGRSRIVLQLNENSQVVLFLGVNGGDQRYTISASAFADGESLHCSGIGDAPTDQAARRLADRGLKVRWIVVPPAGQHAEVLTPSESAPPGRVVGAEMESEGSVRVFVAAPGQEPAKGTDPADGTEFVLSQLLSGTRPGELPVHDTPSLSTEGSQC
ncbi:hypothetical protein [Lentzea sp. NPDC051838]|uniref:hypothetical protein n=1 Tax=Lentzea sp. NPDC051838 TaxID=3154849 RepID=UPI00341D2B5B